MQIKIDLLGCSSQADVQNILYHTWFKDLNREKMLKKQISPPFSLKVKGTNGWMEELDKEYTSQIATYDERKEHKESQQYKNIFKNF